MAAYPGAFGCVSSISALSQVKILGPLSQSIHASAIGNSDQAFLGNLTATVAAVTVGSILDALYRPAYLNELTQTFRLQSRNDFVVLGFFDLFVKIWT